MRFHKFPVGASGLAVLLLAVTFLGCSKKSTNSSTSPPPSGNSVSIAGFAFSPSSKTVAVGATITWTNNDGTTHTVTSDQSLFDSGNIPTGQSFSHTFSSAGTFSYHCAIHTYMTGSIVVQ